MKLRTERSKGESIPKIKSKYVRVNAQNNARGQFAARLTELFLALQFFIIVFVYASLAYLFPVFFYISLALTALCGVHAFITVKDTQIKASWLVLLLLSCGFGYIVYFLSSKVICFGADRRKFKAVYARSRNFSAPYVKPNASQTVVNDCAYFYNAGGFAPYTGTEAKYFPSAVLFFDDVLKRIESAQKFIFLEFFIVADGVLLEKFINVLQRKVAEGVEVKLLYDGAGSRGLMRADTKKRLIKAGVQIKVFSKLVTLFNFNLNFRDHRKVVVIDGKTAYTCGCNIADECINEYGAKVWKDAGIRLDGAAVDEMSLIFLRQWDFVSGGQSDFKRYSGFAESLQNGSVFVPFAGGPDVGEICRGAYC
ncbi:MAG: hypothetical protein K2N33_03555, partial [Clostridia bacterium]|nr:hypothetical protein [Clostridia bacterium]